MIESIKKWIPRRVRVVTTRLAFPVPLTGKIQVGECLFAAKKLK
jgi:hypothetical protein